MAGVSTTNRSNIAAADGVTTVFNYTFFVYSTDHIKVYSVLDDELTPITTGITKAINTSFIGGTVTFNVAPDSDVGEILIRREVPYTQTTEFQDLTRYKETAIEKALNILVLEIQQVAEESSLSLKYTEAAGVTDAVIETPVDEAVVVFSGTTGRLRAGPTVGDIEYAADYAADAAADAAAAAAALAATELARDQALAAANGMKYRSVRFSTTVNDTLSGLAARDGITPVAGERALAQFQSAPAQNGIYVCAAGAWTRASDMDTWDEVVSSLVVVAEGTLYADRTFLCTSNAGGTLGVTAITFIDWQAFIADASIANAKLANMAEATFKMRAAGAGTGVPIDGTATQATAALNAFAGDSGSGALKGLVPAASAGVGAAGKVLRGDATFGYVGQVSNIEGMNSGTTRDFVIPSGATEIDVCFVGVSVSGTSNFLVQVGTGGVPSNTNYASAADYGGSNATSTAGFILRNNSAAESHSGILKLVHMGSNQWVAAGSLKPNNAAGAGGVCIGDRSPLGGALDILRVTTVNGTDTFDAGLCAIRVR